MNLADLKKPFAPDRISWRVGSTTKDKAKGMALAYIDARDVQDRLDEVCGVDGWQCRYVPMHDKKTVCEIGIRINQGGIVGPTEWIWKADGAGDSDVEAEKGALSDAFKRAAVKWGIGRYLYDLDSPWVELDTYEKGGAVYAKGIKAGEYAKLRALLAGSAKPSAPPPPAEPTPKERAVAWVAKAEKAVLAIRDRAGMAAWSKANAAALDQLQSSDKALYNALNMKIALRNDELEAMAKT